MKKSLILLTMLVFLALAVSTTAVTAVCSQSLTVIEGEHIVLTGSPYLVSDPDAYSYLWTPNGWAPKEGATDSPTGNHLFIFDAPAYQTTGTNTYTISLDIGTEPVASSCKATCVVTITVVKCPCPSISPNYCTKDKPTWTYTPCHTDSSLSYHWLVGKTNVRADASEQAGTASYSPIWAEDNFNIPDMDPGTATSYVWFIVQQNTGESNGETPQIKDILVCGPTPIVLAYDPTPNIAIAVTTP